MTNFVDEIRSELAWVEEDSRATAVVRHFQWFKLKDWSQFPGLDPQEGTVVVRTGDETYFGNALLPLRDPGYVEGLRPDFVSIRFVGTDASPRHVAFVVVEGNAPTKSQIREISHLGPGLPTRGLSDALASSLVSSSQSTRTASRRR